MEDYQKDKIIQFLILLKYMGFEKIDRSLIEVSPLNGLREEVSNCKKCRLYKMRRKAVFGEGSSDADLMIIGEAPGEEEDRQGVPFVGAAGMKLNQILNRAGLKRENVFITNVVKCRPPENRNPKFDEIRACNEYLKRQIRIIEPKVIVLLGNVALSLVTDEIAGITKMRGKNMKYLSYPAVPTFHPAYVIRNPSSENLVVSDFKKAAEKFHD